MSFHVTITCAECGKEVLIFLPHSDSADVVAFTKRHEKVCDPEDD